ncbi:hypothetical protein [Hydrogenimonas cancrithermarum]|nr:hypothetical protein [Hydrogenimonas cancrithermarum]
MKRILMTLFLLLSTFTFADEMAEKIRLQNQSVVKAAAEAMSKELPKRVDPHTQLIGIKADGEKLIYTFEIDAAPKNDEAIVKEGKERMRKNVTAGVCNTSRRFLESGITIAYHYVSAATTRELFRFDVDKTACNYR